jgi:hypothetical protein
MGNLLDLGMGINRYINNYIGNLNNPFALNHNTMNYRQPNTTQYVSSINTTQSVSSINPTQSNQIQPIYSLSNNQSKHKLNKSNSATYEHSAVNISKFNYLVFENNTDHNEIKNNYITYTFEKYKIPLTSRIYMFNMINIDSAIKKIIFENFIKKWYK